VLHLQLLQSKLQQDRSRHAPPYGYHGMRFIGWTCVQILVDFTRPRDLHFEEIDMRDCWTM